VRHRTKHMRASKKHRTSENSIKKLSEKGFEQISEHGFWPELRVKTGQKALRETTIRPH
jgi:hypothetical protein